MFPAGPAYENVDPQKISDASPEDHTTGGSAPEGQYSALILNEKIPRPYETINLPNGPNNLLQAL